jgi:hypothetical protein
MDEVVAVCSSSATSIPLLTIPSLRPATTALAASSACAITEIQRPYNSSVDLIAAGAGRPILITPILANIGSNQKTALTSPISSPLQSLNASRDGAYIVSCECLLTIR